MKKKLIVLGLLVMGIAVFSQVLANADWDEIWMNVSRITYGKFFLFLAFTQISYGLFNMRWKIILSCHGYKIPFWKLWLYRASGYGVSYITPTQVGGEPVRIYYLHENHGIRLRDATASVLLDKLIEISTFIIFVASGLIAISFTNLVPRNSLIPFIGLIAVLAIVTGYIFKKLLDGSGFLTTIFRCLSCGRIRFLSKFEQKIYATEKLIMDFLRNTEHKRTTIPIIFLISMGAWSATIAEYFILSSFLGISFTAYEIFLISTIPQIAYLLPVPGGLGVLEGAQVGMFKLLGYSTGMALAVMVFVRIKEITFSCVGFIYSFTHGATLLGKKSKKNKVMRSSLLKPRKIRKTSIKKSRMGKGVLVG